MYYSFFLLVSMFFTLKIMNLCVICSLEDLNKGIEENIFESCHQSLELLILLQAKIQLFMNKKEQCGI